MYHICLIMLSKLIIPILCSRREHATASGWNMRTSKTDLKHIVQWSMIHQKGHRLDKKNTLLINYYVEIMTHTYMYVYI